MRIRNIKRSDYAAVDSLLLQLHRVDVRGRPELFTDIRQYLPQASFESLVDNQEIISILAEVDGAVVGCCFASMMDRSGMVKMKTAYIDLLVVDEAHRRKGIGSALFQAVQRRAKKAGAKRIDLMVWSHNEVAIQAYEAYGMVPQRCIYEIRI